MSEEAQDNRSPAVPRRTGAIGLDVGTYTVQAARRARDGSCEIREEINGFLHIVTDTQTQMMVDMIKTARAPIIEKGRDIFVLGAKALDIAYSWDKPFRRPMKDGLLSVEEKDAFNILGVMLRSIITPLQADETVLAYSCPATPLNVNVDTSYHQKVLQSIFDKAEFNNGWKIKAIPMNEASAIVRGELENEQVTGIGLSFGAGMVNASFCKFGVPIFEFSLVGAGDWVDQASATSTGETPVFINRIKERINLNSEPSNHLERAIIMHYQILLERVSQGLADGIRKAKKRTTSPCKVVVAGGTATPQGFLELLAKQLAKQSWGEFEIGDIVLAPDHKRTVARGLLAFAETANV